MPPNDQLILTAVGPDRVGLVERISKFVARYDCNIEDSKMAVFCGEFAVIMLITGDGKSLAAIGSERQTLESDTGLAVSVKTASPRKTPESYLPYRLTASCMDHPGVVHQISAALSRLGVNIESMETKTYSAPLSGTPLFQLEAELSIPAKTNLNQLREQIAVIQREQNIDIDLAPAKS